MSFDEGMNGHGLYKQAEVRKLRRELMEISPADFSILEKRSSRK